MNAAFESVPKERPVPTLLLRSEKLKLERAAKQQPSREEGNAPAKSFDTEDAAPAAKEIDFESIPPTAVLDQLDEEFFTLLESSKWTDRRDQLTKLEQLLNVERLDNCSYFQLGHLLEKVH